MTPIEELQQRIDLRRAQLRREKSRLQPVAVSVAGGDLRYGELDLTLPEPLITSFGEEDHREHLPRLGEWRIEVDGFVEPVLEPVVVKFGADVGRQPLEGKMFVLKVESQFPPDGYISTLQSTGELTWSDRG